MTASSMPAPSKDSATTEVWTIGRVLRWTQQRFAARNLPSPRLDAELLLAHALSRSRIALYTHFEQQLEPDELSRFRGLIQRRLSGTPVAYLIGEKEFFGLPLRVSEAVLIPRPDTELLVEIALRLLPQPLSASAAIADEAAPPIVGRAEPGVELHIAYDEPVIADEAAEVAESAESPTSPAAPSLPPPSVAAAPLAVVADVGTGSGAVALAIAHRRRDIKIFAIDRSPEALAVATDNAARLALPIELLCGDLLSPLPSDTKLDLIVANLPYIPTAEIDTLQLEVRSEPRAALDGGKDGLDLIRRLITQATTALRPGGALALEIGIGQAPAVEKLLTTAGFIDVHSERDLAHIERVVHGRTPA